MSKKLKAALIQAQILNECYQEDKIKKNLESLFSIAMKSNPDIAVLPEKWIFLSDFKNLESNIQEERGKYYRIIKNLSKDFGIATVSGGIWEKRNFPHEKTKLFITSYFFDENGEEIARQDKLHLYSYEPQIFTPGNELNIIKFKKKNIKFSILICFDVSFYETPRLAVENGSELLISPTLIREEGLYNWKIYLQARALENRVPIVACNPVGELFGRRFPGLSKAIGFKTGYESPSVLKILEAAKDKADVLISDLNLSYPNKIRKKRINEKIPMSEIQIKMVD